MALGSATYEFLLEHAPDSWAYEGKSTWVFTSRELPNDYDAVIRAIEQTALV